MKNTLVKIDNRDTLGGLRKILAQMLEKGLVEALLVPRKNSSGDGFSQSLIKDPAMLADSNPAAPTMAVQSARILTNLTSDHSGSKIGAVLKPCELRAVVELAKFLQVDLDNLLTIGIDCMGTYNVADYSEMSKQGKEPAFPLLASGVKGNGAEAAEDFGIRECCRICEYPVPVNADVSFGFIGYDPSEEIMLLSGGRVEKELEEALGLEFGDGVLENRDREVERLIASRRETKAAVFEDLEGKTAGLDSLMETLSTCIRCHNCMNVCPICYCKECVFDSAVFEHRPDQFLKWAERSGAIRMPTDTLIFHLTRMTHMATSCVGCGMCDAACPNKLPISSLFGLIGSELQEMFEYVPGRDPEEEPPVSAFKEDELQVETKAE